jgi:hypothetical protein
MPRRVLVSLSLAALAIPGCGGGNEETEQAREAAESYVHDLGHRDGEAVCADVTRARRKEFIDALVRANPEIRGRSCGDVMSLALRSLPYDRLQQFSTAKIERVKLTGTTGTFVYRLRDLEVDGKVAREGGRWKVSCCVPGQGS